MISWTIVCLTDSFTVICTTVIGVLLYYYSTSTHGKWRKANVPHTRPVPLFGNLFRTTLGLESENETFDKIYKQFPDKKICGLYQMRTPYLMIRDPELINNVLIKDFAHFTDHGFKMDPSVNFLASSLFFTNGQKWKIMRQKMSPGFTSGKLKLMHSQVKKCSKDMIDYIDAKSKTTDQFDVHDIMNKYATDVIGTCAFGLKLNSMIDEDNEFRKCTKLIFKSPFRIIVANLLQMVSPKLASILKIRFHSPEAMDYFNSTFRGVIEYREKNNVNRNDVAQTLIQARKELVLNNISYPEEKFTEMDIISNAILMYLAGAEPVSDTLAFCLYELAMNKHVQDKLREHINKTKEKHGDEFSNDYLMDLHYADMVITETLRKVNGTIILFRIATKTYQVPNSSLVIEKGQQIIIPNYSIHHDPKYYPNPDVFDPERFSLEEKSKRPSGTELLFGDGPRFCIGKRLAELEMKLGLSEIISKFEVLPCVKTENPIKLAKAGGAIRPKNGIWLCLKPIVV
ncbi:probable cytochrome P450 6a13 [Rhopalosiphum padi]|uniref:probable cytochrome P450 6a13 n=1 Tax=Rhopalosiphum padi TaxID=40932 RepID=UPI00298EA27F|nr:probable cytochrome P450 6a13 [Rhopalosiphum padi]UOW66148.1 cytochrome P450 6CY13-1 [Rhopalosiphum padi]WOV89614.1 cytochrome P450 CYP6CY13 [Rhopalosiphum padi]